MAPDRRVDFVRHKVKSSYVIENFAVETADVEDFNVSKPKFEKAKPGTKIALDFGSDCHHEVEVRSKIM